MMPPLQAERGALLFDREMQPAPPAVQTGKSQQPVLASLGRRLAANLTRLFHWLQKTRCAQLSSKRLRVCETVSLGDKRAIFLVQVDGRRFLVGGAPTSISLLAQLDGAPCFPEILKSEFDSQQAEE